MNKFIVIIPARLKSSRLSEKLIHNIAGKPLLYYTYTNAIKSNAAKVIIATDSTKIIDIMQKFNIECVRTTKEHKSGTSRIKEVVQSYNFADEDIIINVQGDEPLMSHQNINQLNKNLLQNNVEVATLYEKFTNIKDYLAPDNVKVIINDNNRAVYFSRAAIPHFRDGVIDLSICFKHIGIYGYKAKFFNNNIHAGAYEEAEQLEQLSILQQGYAMHIAQAEKKTTIGIDTLEDLQRFKKIINDNN